jgi:hypothetical protein
MEQMRKDLDQMTANVQNLMGAMNFLSQRVAWSENCFKQVQESGAMQMTEAVRKVMNDHKKLLSQVNMLSMRLVATQGDSGGESGGAPPPLMVRPSMNK